MAGRHANAMEIEAMAVTMESDPLKDDQITQARKTVVSQAIREHPDDDKAAADRAREMLLMLGIHSSQEVLTDSKLGPVLLNSIVS